jgi:hypothetical protein
MAWRRGKDKGPQPPEQATPSQVAPVIIEDLPDVRSEEDAEVRKALKQVKKADSELKKLRKKEVKANKREERRLRRFDRRLAKMDRSKDVGPTRLMVSLLAFNGAAASYIMIAFWWPEWQLVPPLFMESDHYWEVVALCYILFAGLSAFVLAGNPYPDNLERARLSLMVYFSLGLIAIFTGLLLGFVLVDLELWNVDWVFWQMVMVYLIAGSAIPMAVIYLVAYRPGSQLFLSTRYYQVMGILTMILVVALIFLALVFLPERGVMEEVSISLMTIGLTMCVFVWPAVVSSIVIEARGLSMMGHQTTG